MSTLLLGLLCVFVVATNVFWWELLRTRRKLESMLLDRRSQPDGRNE